MIYRAWSLCVFGVLSHLVHRAAVLLRPAGVHIQRFCCGLRVSTVGVYGPAGVQAGVHRSAGAHSGGILRRLDWLWGCGSYNKPEIATAVPRART